MESTLPILPELQLADQLSKTTSKQTMKKLLPILLLLSAFAGAIAYTSANHDPVTHSSRTFTHYGPAH